MTSASAASSNAAWFCALAEPLSAGECEHARACVQTLLGSVPDILVVDGWAAAKEIINAPKWNVALWQAEQRERYRLMEIAQARLGNAPMLRELTASFESISDTLHGCAAVAAARMGCGDAGLIRAAAGAATEALYLAGLARVAVQPEEQTKHAFGHKLALFEAGHWPLALVDNNYYVF